jgi:hypothetical protein
MILLAPKKPDTPGFTMVTGLQAAENIHIYYIIKKT